MLITIVKNEILRKNYICVFIFKAIWFICCDDHIFSLKNISKTKVLERYMQTNLQVCQVQRIW